MARSEPSPVSLLSVEEVAQYLEVRPSTVATWCRQGRLPGLKVGKSWRIRRAALDEFLERNEHHPSLVGQLRAFLRVPDQLLCVTENQAQMHRLDAAFFQLGEAQGGRLVKFYGGEETSLERLRDDLERHGLAVGPLEAAGRLRLLHETDPAAGRVAALTAALADEQAGGAPLWVSFNWTEQVDLATALRQQAALAALVGEERLVMKTDVLAAVVDEWPSDVQRQARSLYRGIVELTAQGLILGRRVPLPDR